MISRNSRTLLIATFVVLVVLGVTLLQAVSTPLASSAAVGPAMRTAAPVRSRQALIPSQRPKLPPPNLATPVLVAPPGTVIHVVQKGESLPSIIRHYLSPSSFMTVAELDAALRAVNGDKKGNMVKPGEALIIPGMEGPIVEKAIPVPKDYEARAIYLTGGMAGGEHGQLIMKHWRQVGGNAVVFDAKDSDGIVNVPFQHPLVPPGHRPPIQNLPKLARFLHRQGMHIIARIAIFRDQYLAENHPELAVQSRRNKQAWRENGKLVWLDPSRQEVQQYNIALAKFVADSGVDEIQFDYVRFPAEGDQKDARFAFEAQHPDWTRADVIAGFLKDAYAATRAKHVLFSLDVFGVMAWQRPIDLSHTGQDIVRMAKECDVLSPMIYPSHFFGMEGYKDPGDAPEHFITESMERFQKITAGSGVVLRPWLQAFGWRTKTYSPEYIRTQVVAAKAQGGIGFLFWNARNDYGKPFTAMPDMHAAPGRFFRGDELPPPNATASARPAGLPK